MNRILAFLFILLISLLGSSPLLAQQVVSASPDVTIDLGSGVLPSDEDVTVDNQLGLVLLENLGALPDASDVIALGLDANGDRLLAFDTTTLLSGGTVARPGDVVRYDGAAYAIVFDSTAEGLPNGVLVDAVSLQPTGLLLSFDTTVDLPGGVIADDEDLVRFDGANFSLAFDGSAEGLAAALDVDAAQDLGGGAFAMSFDTTGAIGGIVFADEDVVLFDGANWTLEYDGSAANANWAPADLDAVMIPEPGFAPAALLAAFGLGWVSRAKSAAA